MRAGHRPAWRRRPQSRAARRGTPGHPDGPGPDARSRPGVTGGPSSTAISQTAAERARALRRAQPRRRRSVPPAPPLRPRPRPRARRRPRGPNVSCDIIVPADALTAQGLATPFQAHRAERADARCVQLHDGQFRQPRAFVQATIPTRPPARCRFTGRWSSPRARSRLRPRSCRRCPPAPSSLGFGFNGTNLTQVGATRDALRQANCVNGLRGSIFGRVSFCNGARFFQAAAQAEAQGKLTGPAPAPPRRCGHDQPDNPVTRP